MTLFSVTTFVLFHFGLEADTVRGALASGVLWVTLLFASVLGVNRLFVADAEQGGFDGFLMAPVERSALLASKALTLIIYLVAVEIVAVSLVLAPSGGPWLIEDGPPWPTVVLACDGLNNVFRLSEESAVATTTLLLSLS